MAQAPKASSLESRLNDLIKRVYPEDDIDELIEDIRSILPDVSITTTAVNSARDLARGSGWGEYYPQLRHLAIDIIGIASMYKWGTPVTANAKTTLFNLRITFSKDKNKPEYKQVMAWIYKDKR